MSKRKRPEKKVEKKPEEKKGPKLEGRKLKQMDHVRLRELHDEAADLRVKTEINKRTGVFLLKAYVKIKDGEILRKLDLDQGIVVVQLAPKEEKK